jgi:hypothetical protein
MHFTCVMKTILLTVLIIFSSCTLIFQNTFLILTHSFMFGEAIVMLLLIPDSIAQEFLLNSFRWISTQSKLTGSLLLTLSYAVSVVLYEVSLLIFIIFTLMNVPSYPNPDSSLGHPSIWLLVIFSASPLGHQWLYLELSLEECFLFFSGELWSVWKWQRMRERNPFCLLFIISFHPIPLIISRLLRLGNGLRRWLVSTRNSAPSIWPSSGMELTLVFLHFLFLQSLSLSLSLSLPYFSDISLQNSLTQNTLVFLMRLSPLLPFPLLSYVFGISQVNFFDYVIGTLAGLIPGPPSCLLLPPSFILLFFSFFEIFLIHGFFILFLT